MEAVSKPESIYKPTNRQFRPRVLAPDAAHSLASFLGCQRVHLRLGFRSAFPLSRPRSLPLGRFPVDYSFWNGDHGAEQVVESFKLRVAKVRSALVLASSWLRFNSLCAGSTGVEASCGCLNLQPHSSGNPTLRICRKLPGRLLPVRAPRPCSTRAC